MNLIKNKIISNKYTLNDLFDEFDKMCINIIPNYNVLYKLYRIQKTNQVKLKQNTNYICEYAEYHTCYGNNYESLSKYNIKSCYDR